MTLALVWSVGNLVLAVVFAVATFALLYGIRHHNWGGEDSSDCDHPDDAVYWNEYAHRTLCHRCGQTLPDKKKAI